LRTPVEAQNTLSGCGRLALPCLALSPVVWSGEFSADCLYAEVIITLRYQSSAVCHAAGLGRRRGEVQAAGLESLRQMVMAGIGIALVPKLATFSPFGAGDLAVYRRFAPPEPTRDLVLAWRRSFPRGDALQELTRG
jgi:DNA-binding transcriptional LysR family regulator